MKKRASQKKIAPVKPTGFTPEQIAAVSSARDSGKTPTDVLRAFLGGSITLRDITIPPMDMARFMALEAIGSPLIDPPDAKREMKAIDMARAMVLMMATLSECRRLISDTTLIDDAAWDLASRIPLTDLSAFAGLTEQAIANGFSTVISEKKSKE